MNGVRLIPVFILGILLVSCPTSQLLLDLEKKPGPSPSSTPGPLPINASLPSPTLSEPGGNYVSLPSITVTNVPSGGVILFTNDGSPLSYDAQGTPKGSTLASYNGSLWWSTASPTMVTYRLIFLVNGQISTETDAVYRQVGEGGPEISWAGQGVQGGTTTALAEGPSNVVFGGGAVGGSPFAGTVSTTGVVSQSVLVTGGAGTVTGLAFNQGSSTLLVVGTLTTGGAVYSFGNGKTVTALASPATTAFLAAYTYPGLVCQAAYSLTFSGTITSIATSGSLAAVTGNFTGPATGSVGSVPVNLPRTGSNGVLILLSVTGSGQTPTAVLTSTASDGQDWFNAAAIYGSTVGVFGSAMGTVQNYGSGTLTLYGSAKSPLYILYNSSTSTVTTSATLATNTPGDGECMAAAFDQSGNLVGGGYQTGPSTWLSFAGSSAGQNAMLFSYLGGSPNMAEGSSGAAVGNSQITGLCYDSSTNAFLVVGYLSAGTTGFGSATFPALTQTKPFLAQVTSGFLVQWLRMPDSPGAGLTYSAVAPTVPDPTTLSSGLIPVGGTATGGAPLNLGSGYQVIPAVPGSNPYFSWLFK